MSTKTSTKMKYVNSAGTLEEVYWSTYTYRVFNTTDSTSLHTSITRLENSVNALNQNY